MRGPNAWLGGLLLVAGAATVTILAGRREAPGPVQDPDVPVSARTDEVPTTPTRPTAPIDGDARPAGPADDGAPATTDPTDGARAPRTQPRGDRRIEGRVMDAAGGPVVGATVEARALPPPQGGSFPPLTTTTDAEGSFALVGLASGPWAVLARHPAFAGSVPLVTEAGASGLALSLGTLGWIEGTLRTTDGSPPEGAWVVGLAADGATAPERVVPVHAGQFRSEGLVAGTFRVSARATDVGPDAATTVETLVVASGRPVAVSDGVATNVELVLRRGAVIRGRVEDAASQAPLAGVAIRGTLDGVATTGGRTSATATSGADGTFELAALASGPWFVEADSATYTGPRERLVLPPEATAACMLALATWTPLRLKVVDEAGRAVDGATVTVQRDGVAVRVRDADGTTSGSRVPGGAVRTILVPPGELTVVAQHPTSGRVARPTPVTVVAGVAGEVEVVLRPRRTPPPRDR